MADVSTMSCAGVYARAHRRHVLKAGEGRARQDVGIRATVADARKGFTLSSSEAPQFAGVK